MNGFAPTFRHFLKTYSVVWMCLIRSTEQVWAGKDLAGAVNDGVLHSGPIASHGVVFLRLGPSSSS